MLRYGVMSRPAPSELPDPEPTDARSLENFNRNHRVLEYERRQREAVVHRPRLVPPDYAGYV